MKNTTENDDDLMFLLRRYDPAIPLQESRLAQLAANIQARVAQEQQESIALSNAKEIQPTTQQLPWWVNLSMSASAALILGLLTGHTLPNQNFSTTLMRNSIESTTETAFLESPWKNWIDADGGNARK